MPIRDAARPSPYRPRPLEQMIEEIGYRWNLMHRPDLYGDVLRQAGFATAPSARWDQSRRRGAQVQVHTDVPPPYQVS